MGEIINVLAIINTYNIIRDIPNPAQYKKKPTRLDPKYQYMVVADNNGIASGTKDKGIAVVKFAAKVGDRIQIHGTSEDTNFEKSILIYQIQKSDGNSNKVFGDFRLKTFKQSTTAPSGPVVLPANFVDSDFWFFEADVAMKGTGNYQICFALYVNTKLKGYFYLDTMIEVY